MGPYSIISIKQLNTVIVCKITWVLSARIVCSRLRSVVNIVKDQGNWELC